MNAFRSLRRRRSRTSSEPSESSSTPSQSSPPPSDAPSSSDAPSATLPASIVILSPTAVIARGAVLHASDVSRYAPAVFSGMPVSVVRNNDIVGRGQALMPGELLAGAGGGVADCMRTSPCVLVTEVL